jgi:aminopeptidase N
VAKTLTAALHSDSLKSSHPISVDVKDPAEINEIFDNISYEKASYVKPSMHCILGTPFLENVSVV